MSLRFVILVSVAGGLSAAAGAQPADDGRLRWKDLRRVEQGRADQSALDTAAAQPPKDLKVPNDFSGVYRIPKDADSRYAGWFARVGGGLTAVFPQSVYVPTPQGNVAIVPPGTVFMLGGIPTHARGTDAAERPQENPQIVSRVDESAPALHQMRPDEVRHAAGAPDPLRPWKDATERLFSDEGYRGKRVALLLDSAGE